MKVSTKLLLGAVAILPLAVSLIWGGTILYLFSDPPVLEQLFFSIHPIVISFFNLGLFFLSCGPVIFYIVHAARNPDLADRRAAWIVLLVLCGFLMPVYWFLFVWRDSYYES